MCLLSFAFLFFLQKYSKQPFQWMDTKGASFYSCFCVSYYVTFIGVFYLIICTNSGSLNETDMMEIRLIMALLLLHHHTPHRLLANLTVIAPVLLHHVHIRGLMWHHQIRVAKRSWALELF